MKKYILLFVFGLLLLISGLTDFSDGLGQSVSAEVNKKYTQTPESVHVLQNKNTIQGSVLLSDTQQDKHIIEGFSHVGYNYYNDKVGYPEEGGGLCWMGCLASIITYYNNKISPELVAGLMTTLFGGPYYEDKPEPYFWPHNTMFPAVQIDHELHSAMLMGFDAALLDIKTKKEALKILKYAVSQDIPVYIGQDWNYCIDEYAEQSPLFLEYKKNGLKNGAPHFIVVTGYDDGIYYVHDAIDILPYGYKYLEEDIFLEAWKKGPALNNPELFGDYPKGPYTLLVFSPSEEESDIKLSSTPGEEEDDRKFVHYTALKDAHFMFSINDVSDELFAAIARMSWKEIQEVFLMRFSEWPPDFKFGAEFFREARTYWGGETYTNLNQAAKLYDECYRLIDNYIKNEMNKEIKKPLITFFEELKKKKQRIVELLNQALEIIEANNPDLRYQKWNTKKAMDRLMDLAYQNGRAFRKEVLGSYSGEAGGNGLKGVAIKFSGGGGKARTNSKGDYSKKVKNGWKGKVTPSKAGYTFSPLHRTYAEVTSDKKIQNYTAAQLTYVISGKIETKEGIPIQGVIVEFSKNGGTAETDINGEYSIEVKHGWSGTATPSLAGYTFSPRKKTHRKVKADKEDQNYRATLSSNST